jgi:4-amino-4-deoxychorismate lyase
MDSGIDLFSSLRYDPLLTDILDNSEFSQSRTPSPFYMLAYHRDRILQAAEHLNYDQAAKVLRGGQGLELVLRKLTEIIDTQCPSPLRVRILVSPDGTLKVESNPVPVVRKETLYPSRLPPPKEAPQTQVSSLTGGALILGKGDAVSGDPPTSDPWVVMADPMKTAPTLYTSYKTTCRDMYNSARERVGIKDMAEKREVLLVSNNHGEIMEGSLTTPYLWRNGKWTTPHVSSGGQIGTTRRWALEKGYVKIDGTSGLSTNNPTDSVSRESSKLTLW